MVEGNKYKYLLKIQNNKSQAITYVRIYIYYPENGLNLQDSNPQTISTIAARQILEITFHFLITDPILEGTIQAVVMYLDEAQELQTVSVSPQLVENLSGNLNPIEMDPKSFAQVLQESQSFTSNIDHFAIDQMPQTVFTKIQHELEMMKIHVQNVSQSQESNGFAAVIHGIAQPTQMDKPFIVEIGLNSSESKPLTEIHVRASSPSEQSIRL